VISLSVALQGNKTGSVKLAAFNAALVPNMIRGVNKATTRLEREIKKNLSKGGRFRVTEGQPWVPNPGPHLRIGNDTLRSSWRAHPAKRVGNDVEGRVTTWVPYAARHEFGDEAAGIRKRPYVRPAIKDKKDEMALDLGHEVVRPLR